MVTTIDLLNRCRAGGIISYIVVLLPYLKLVGAITASFGFNTCVSFMRAVMAGSTGRSKAIVTVECGRLFGWRSPIEAVAIRSRAILKVLWVASARCRSRYSEDTYLWMFTNVLGKRSFKGSVIRASRKNSTQLLH
jgi:hypothetical protein